MPTVEENAYFAGLLDGEGSIGVVSNHGINPHRHFYPRVIITNTHKGVCDIAKTLYGGCVYQRKDMNGRKSPCFNWVLTSRLADEFLRLTLPYLIIKKAQAELALSYYRDIYLHIRAKELLNQQQQDNLDKRQVVLIEQIKSQNRR